MSLISVVIPAKNEAASIGKLVEKIVSLNLADEIIVVDDGSTDDTATLARTAGAKVISSPYSLGNGGAVRRGARAAQGEIIVFMDGDGQHQASDIPLLTEKLAQGYDMAVGARNRGGQASHGRHLANTFYNRLASWMTGHTILDLTSGFRAVRRSRFREISSLLPNGFSYPTTSTMAFFRSGYPVAYVPVDVRQRTGASHIKPIRDGLRFLLIIFKIGTLYSPLKLFIPISLAFSLLGLIHYLYTFFTEHRFTNMSALMFSMSVIIFLIGLVSEQITQLTYLKNASDQPLDPAEEDCRS